MRAVLFAFLIVVGFWLRSMVQKEEFNMSPCGTTNMTTNYSTPSGDRMYRNFDDGNTIYRIKGIKASGDMKDPVVEWEVVVRRSEQGCEEWKYKKNKSHP